MITMIQLFSKNIHKEQKILFYLTGISTMSSWASADERILKIIRKIIPNLNNTKYKGQDGRIGIFGGSAEYTGAPYFAAMSALRTGADLVHVFCAKEASIPIKSFSPDVIVHGILDQSDAIKHIKPWLDCLHVIVIGPGLGRDEKTFRVIVELISICREMQKPLVIDADGLYLITQKPEVVINYPNLILTPNAVEFIRLVKSVLKKTIEPSPVVKSTDVKDLADSFGERVVILCKGTKDLIVSGQEGTDIVWSCMSGSGRRCGGQGDLLVGSIAVFWWWAICNATNEASMSPAILASYAGSRLIRECNAAAYKIKQRATLASDMLEQIQCTFAKIFETHNNK
ncbi:PREDICTED: ATP-dependent (S)-NAD(P)H-hydrate dehydratase isoform X1 [Polistes canadensis]|uniref:ATP-dependent (S)-NAD(P)H-hydrate dehydratase isoform X1 n=2 Tax=Polistes canadensis TaxID=91411 RepID=UPI000718B51C|nr:PREDICTED: ATP-dependent (S)-NAD(P)H-hydrate dehydratase isoform X1 [Polistes canadensis]